MFKAVCATQRRATLLQPKCIATSSKKGNKLRKQFLQRVADVSSITKAHTEHGYDVIKVNYFSQSEFGEVVEN